MNNATEKIITLFKKEGLVCQGREGIDKETGEKYRFDAFRIEQPTAKMINLFAAAAAENGRRKTDTQFMTIIGSFYFDRAVYKGQENGAMQYSEMINL